MKIIHCADLHLDSAMETHLTTQKAEIRRVEIQKTFEKMVEYAKENQVSVILIAGDLFDTATGRNRKIKERVLDVIRCAPNIDFLYLSGNHDADDDFCDREKCPANLKFFEKDWTSYRYGRVCITGKEQCEADTASIDSLALREDEINIVALHGQAVSAKSSSRPQDIPLLALQHKGIDYLALGHLHQYRRETLDERGVYCYSGCLEGRGFDECGEKGAVLLDVDESGVRSEFVPFAYRCCYDIRVDIGGAVREKEILNRIEEKISNIAQTSLVKLTLCGEIEPETDVDLAYLENYYEGRFFLFKIQNSARIRICYEDFENDISLKGEFIRQVRSTDLPEKDKEMIIATGIRALMGRESGR